MVTGRHHGARLFRYFVFALAGVVVGAIGMAIGGFLASGDNRWAHGLYHSAAGILGAPLAALAWATHRYRRAQIFAGIAIIVGLISGMTMLFELTEEHSSIKAAAAESSLALTAWLFLWALWVSLALTRLIVIKPEKRTRQRLSPHHHRAPTSDK